MGFVLLGIAADAARDPSSHNPWPFESLMFGLPCLAVIAGLALARRLSKRADPVL